MKKLLLLLLCGCSSTPNTPEENALLQVKAFISMNMDDLYAAVQQLQKAAPLTGWDGTSAALPAMKDAWKRARKDYEHIEGAIAVLFPDIDFSTDQRYDAFLSANGPDDDMFDDMGVTGIHAIERILWSDSIPDRVVKFEMGLAGYSPAAFPTTDAQATEFHDKLCGRLVTDVNTMRTEFGPLALDPAAAYRGVIGSINEQVEKVNKAATGEEESRYAQYTLADMRANVEAGVVTYQAFRPWLLSKKGSDLDGKISDGFNRVQAAYAMLSGDALPPVPMGWTSVEPSNADLATPFGMLWQVLQNESDPTVSGSLVQVMTQSADLMGIAELPQ
jgi:iron uptake system component EfeO